MLQLALQRTGKAAECLPQRHGDGILQLRAPHLDDVGEVRLAAAQLVDERLQVGQDLQVAGVEAHVDGRGVGVVRRLRTVHLVVGRAVSVFARTVAHVEQRHVGDDFVGVHVRAGPRAALYHVHGELVVIAAGADGLAGGPYAGVLFVREQAQFVVRGSRGLFCPGQAAEKGRIVREAEAADGEVLDAAQCLDAVERVGRQLALAQQVVLRACLLFLFHYFKV